MISSKSKWIFLTIVIILAMVLIPFPQQSLTHALRSPQWVFWGWLGYSPLGEAMLSNIFWGGLQTIALAGIGRCLAVTVAYLGIWASSLLGSLFESVLARLAEAVMTIPALLLALALSFSLGGGAVAMIITIAVSEWSMNQKWLLTRYTEIQRQAFITVSRSFGASSLHIFTYHIAPIIRSDVALLFKTYLPASILTVASLEFLGLSSYAGVNGLGFQIAAYKDYFFTSPHIILTPVLALMGIIYFFGSKTKTESIR